MPPASGRGVFMAIVGERVAASVLEDQRGLELPELGPPSDLLGDQLAQVLDVTYGDMHHQIVGPGDIVQIPNFGEPGEVRPEPLHELTLVLDQSDKHQGLEGDAEGLGINVGVEAPDDPVLGQSFDPFEAARRSEADQRRELLVALPSIVLQGREDLVVGSVEGSSFSAHPISIRWTKRRTQINSMTFCLSQK